jgi:hydrogenase maturation protease
VNETLEPVRVLGLGNVLMGDDALGPWVIESLQAGWEFPEGVSVLDVGTPGLDLTPFLADADTVILVDTVKANAPPGTLRVYSRAQLATRAPSPRVSPHDPGLTEALFALDFVGSGPRDVILVGVVPASTEPGIGLSPEVGGAVEGAAREIVALLSCLGRTPRRLRDAPPVTPWWERGADVRVELCAGA